MLTQYLVRSLTRTGCVRSRARSVLSVSSSENTPLTLMRAASSSMPYCSLRSAASASAR